MPASDGSSRKADVSERQGRGGVKRRRVVTAAGVVVGAYLVECVDGGRAWPGRVSWVPLRSLVHKALDASAAPFLVESSGSDAAADRYGAARFLLCARETRSSAIAEGPRDASCQLKSCQLPRNSAETTCTTSTEPGISCR